MSRIIKCLAIDGPCQGRTWESYSHDVNVKLRGRGGVEHQYRMSAAYPDAAKPVEYFWNDPQRVKPTESAAAPICDRGIGSVTPSAPAGTVTDRAPVPDRRITDPCGAASPLFPGTLNNPL